jgi:hypothetical protein
VAKFSADGSTLLYCSYLGGSGQEWSSAATGALDSEDNLYIIGTTQSANFPTTPGAYDRHYEPSHFGDMFITKMDPEGNLIASTFLGGTGDEEGIAIGLDENDFVYITGWSRSAGFPGTNSPNMYDSSLNGGYDVVVAKLTPDLSNVLYATYIGSPGLEVPQQTGFFVDAVGNVYLAGSTYSSRFPTTPGAFDTTWNGTNTSYHGDGFVLKLKSDFSDLVFSSYLGGSNGDRATGIHVDENEYVYVTGMTMSPNFPETFGNPYNGGTMDGFLTKISPDGSSIIFSMFIGGDKLDSSGLVSTGPAGEIYLSSGTESTNLYTSPDAYASYHSGDKDGYFTVFSSTGEDILYATYIGGSGTDGAGLRVVDSEGNFYFSAGTYSSNFPTTPGAYDQTFNGNQDGAIIKFIKANQPPTASTTESTTANEGSAVLLTAVGTDPDGDPLSYAWDEDGDGLFETPGQTLEFSAAYLDGPVTVSVGFQVCDDNGLCDSAAFVVDVLNVAPEVDAGLDQTVLVNTPVYFEGTFSDPGFPDTHTAEWDFGDGETSPELSATHAYLLAGTYSAALTVTDDDGGVGVAPIMVTVLSQQEASEDIIEKIENLVNNELLNPGNANALISKIEAAIASLDKEKPKTATNQLNALLNQLESMIQTEQIDPEIGYSLIAEIEAILASL